MHQTPVEERNTGEKWNTGERWAVVLASYSFCHSYKVPEAGNFANKGGLSPGEVGYIWNPSTREVEAGKREMVKGKNRREKEEFSLAHL